MHAITEVGKAHCCYCFDVLIAKLNNKELPPYPKDLANPKIPVFVTWLYKQQLRGCNGTFAPDPLSDTLGNLALTSSLEDDRFKTITLDEVKQLSVWVSLPYNIQAGKKPMDWEVGKHGIIAIAFFEGEEYVAMYLPEEPALKNWSKEEALRRVLEKSGFKGKLQDIFPAISLTTFESSKSKLDYSQYEKMSK